MTAWHRLSVAELHGAFARGEATPSRVLAHFLARIDQFDPGLRCFIDLDRAGAQVAAAESDRRFAQDSQRPLEGIVVGIKANIAVRGLELNAGMEARRGLLASEDAAIIRQLREAGAIIIGTLNMHEGALGATTDNPFFGRALNPHGQGRSPGGSSGGSGAAVAAGLCTAALGTDTLGSIRIPASYCGVFGLKPTPPDARDPGLVPLSDAFDAIGPMTRSMEDLALFTNVLFAPDLATALRRSTILELEGMGGVELEPAVEAAYRAVLGDLPAIGGKVALPRPAMEIARAAFVTAARDFAVHLVSLGEERCQALSDDVAHVMEFAVSRPADVLAGNAALLAATRATIRAAIGENGIIVMPATPHVAFEQGTRPPRNQADLTALANIAGLPAISIPVGTDAERMPIGIQIVGPPHAEAMLIAQARMINDRARGTVAPPAYW